MFFQSLSLFLSYWEELLLSVSILFHRKKMTKTMKWTHTHTGKVAHTFTHMWHDIFSSTSIFFCRYNTHTHTNRGTVFRIRIELTSQWTRKIIIIYTQCGKNFHFFLFWLNLCLNNSKEEKMNECDEWWKKNKKIIGSKLIQPPLPWIHYGYIKVYDFQ